MENVRTAEHGECGLLNQMAFSEGKGKITYTIQSPACLCVSTYVCYIKFPIAYSK